MTSNSKRSSLDRLGLDRLGLARSRSRRRAAGAVLRALIGLTVIIVPAALVGCDGGQAAAAPRTIEFVVEGMHCDGCAEAISHGVGDVTGVLACRVDHVNGTATIEVASADPQIEAVLAEAIAKLGFVVRYSDAERASPGS